MRAGFVFLDRGGRRERHSALSMRAPVQVSGFSVLAGLDVLDGLDVLA